MTNRKKFTSPLVILLTSTIKPPGATPDRIEVRRQQYAEALTFWLTHPDERISGIVYCDNSTPDLAWTHELVEKIDCKRDFESLHCPDNNIPNGMHYGYPELGIIDYTVTHSKLLGRDPFFAKITGRFKYHRISELLDRLPESYDACIDFRKAYRKERKDWSAYRARTQLIFFRTEFYKKRLLHKRSLMLENQVGYIEEFIPSLLPPSDEACSRVTFRWPIECQPSGVGGNGDNFDSRKRRLKAFVSSSLRRFMPWVWL